MWKAQYNKAGRLWFWGVDVQENSGGTLKLDHAFAFCLASFLMTIAVGGIPHDGSRQSTHTKLLHRGTKEQTAATVKA